jgi:protein-tyrosine phosphatase
MAEVVFSQHLCSTETGIRLPRSAVASAGISAPVGRPAAPYAIEVCAESGLELDRHQAQQLSPALMQAHELCLVMEHHHLNFISRLSASLARKTFLLGHWGQFEIPDPVGAPRAAFIETLNLIQQGAQQWRPYFGVD